MTVREILQLACVQRGRPQCVAGVAALDRPVRWVHAGEVSDIADVLEGGELLLTTGSGMGATAAEQRRYVRRLDQRGVAGLVLELGPQRPQPSRALVEACEEAALPLIALGRQVRFVDITETVHREIVGHQIDVLERSERAARRFTGVLLEGGGVDEVLDELATLVANPALLIRSGGEVAAVALTRTGPGEVLAAHSSGHPSWSVDVPPQNEPWGTLTIVALDATIDAFARACAERAAGAIALALLRRHEDELLTLREQGVFLHAGACGELAIEDVALRADALRFAHDGRALLPFAVAPASGSPSHAWSAAGRDLRRELSQRSVEALLGGVPGQPLLLGVAAVAPGRPRARSAAPLAEAVAAVAGARLGGRTRARLALAPACETWAQAMAALRDAADVAACAVAQPWTPWVDAAKPGLPVLLRRLNGSSDLSSFAHRQLELLDAHEADGGLALTSTLRALCEHGWSKASAARTLGLERPSLYHHIERIERLLGESLDDPLVRTQLHVALLARDQTAAA